jgi:DNA-binding GntR family transcriptional regulator
MSMQDEPGGSLSSEEEAELRAYRRIASALERGDVDALAAALREETDPARPAPGSRERPKEN